MHDIIVFVSSLKNKKILIYGTGAVGGYYGGALVKAGLRNPAFIDVTFIARGKNYEILKEKGLTLIVNNKKEIIPVNVVETRLIASVREKIFDYIIISVKSMDTKNAAESIKEIVRPNTTVVSFQNGIENEEIIGSVIGKEHVIGAYVYIASRMIEPGVVKMTGNHTVTIGEFNGEKTKRILELESIIKAAGVKCIISDDIIADMWNKLAWNTAFNGVSVLTGKTLDQILENKELYDLVKNILSEVKDVAVACEIKIRPDSVEYNLERSKGYTGFKTSTLQDFERGKPVEIEELIGVVVRKAKEKKVKALNVEKVYNELKQKIASSKTFCKVKSN